MNNDRKEYVKCGVTDNGKVWECKIVLFIDEIENEIHCRQQYAQPGKIFFDKRRSHVLKNRQHAADTDSINTCVRIKAEIVKIFNLNGPHIKTGANNCHQKDSCDC